jgi:hypothetical protein
MILSPNRAPSRTLQQLLLLCVCFAQTSPSPLLQCTSASIPWPPSSDRLINPTNLTYLEARITTDSSLNPTECARLID